MIKKIILFLFIATFAFANESYEFIKDECALPLLAPSLQKRKTAKLRLKNGLEVYLISDQKAEQSSVALGVRVGAWQDLKEYPGTAHFLEHMLFMGSEKYLDEYAFVRFIKDHGGIHNAYTAPDRTVYLFSIHHQAFDQAIDRLAQFFIAPLFNPSAVARELYAVDQEYAKNIEDDGRRAYMISKELGNPNHPNRAFSTGNAQTLGQIPQDVLRKWYETNYNANLMTLAIYSSKPIDALIKLVTDTFTQIENKKIQPAEIDQPLSSNAQLGHFIYIEPVKKIQHLTMRWELPASFVEDETKAADLLAYTINQGQKIIF
ncbi:MAG: insulinase family protein [Candidatus Cardinium sp.]|uniref:insulinase family protein n=1 Tax=Cardinium endosymbiont of Dermatophagoides farinae TaxID=2597823 RepID=UPI0011826C56|nr:insulinase family protein [Cardinium endosymbiont of Dermatophagoides farinae]TSJ81177.1 hypothetical protein FPG78_04205 [Cardinium endosymbiont of Dermatophagoides farinae]UWW97223.1 MAG: insulinase family protein [Candidatus Cardinium sp.]